MPTRPLKSSRNHVFKVVGVFIVIKGWVSSNRAGAQLFSSIPVGMSKNQEASGRRTRSLHLGRGHQEAFAPLVLSLFIPVEYRFIAEHSLLNRLAEFAQQPLGNRQLLDAGAHGLKASGLEDEVCIRGMRLTRMASRVVDIVAGSLRIQLPDPIGRPIKVIVRSQRQIVQISESLNLLGHSWFDLRAFVPFVERSNAHELRGHPDRR